MEPTWPIMEPKRSPNGARIGTFLETVDPYETCTGMGGLHVHPPWGSTLCACFCDPGPEPSKNRSSHTDSRTRCQNVSKTGPRKDTPNATIRSKIPCHAPWTPPVFEMCLEAPKMPPGRRNKGAGAPKKYQKKRKFDATTAPALGEKFAVVTPFRGQDRRHVRGISRKIWRWWTSLVRKISR